VTRVKARGSAVELSRPLLSTAFHKYAYEPVRPEEAWKAVSKGEAVVDSPEEHVAILMKHSTK